MVELWGKVVAGIMLRVAIDVMAVGIAHSHQPFAQSLRHTSLCCMLEPGADHVCGRSVLLHGCHVCAASGVCVRCVLLHGGMKPGEKEAAIAQHRAGSHPIMICTSVVEVGVDVPEASIMVVQQADRWVWGHGGLVGGGTPFFLNPFHGGLVG